MRYDKAPQVDIGTLTSYQAITDYWNATSGQRPISISRVQQICRKVEKYLRQQLRDLEADLH
jgi:hypothetical protein